MSKKHKKERFELQLDHETAVLLRDLAKKSGLSRADVLRQLVRRANVTSVLS